MKKARSEGLKKNSGISMIPNKDALLAQETRRNDRLARENSFLRILLQKARHGSKTSENSSIISFE